MLPFNFEGSRIVGKPETMTDEQCSAIPAKRGEIPENIVSIAYTWAQDLPNDTQLPKTIEDLKKYRNEAFIEALSNFKTAVFHGIPAYHAIDQNHFPFWLTAWKPNKEDLEALNRGEPIYIKSIAEFLVPMALFTMNEEGGTNEV